MTTQTTGVQLTIDHTPNPATTALHTLHQLPLPDWMDAGRAETTPDQPAADYWHCTAGSWVAMSAPLRCRRCNTRLAGGILGSSGCEELEFCRAGLVPCPAPDHPDGRCPLWPAPAA